MNTIWTSRRRASRGAGRALPVVPIVPIALLLAAGLAWAPEARAATIWDGPLTSFSKGDFVDVADPANQDPILPGVVLTRGSTKGLFNIALEDFYTGSSPLDTEWAWSLNNPGADISAANYANLDFAPWARAHGGRPPDTLGIPGVLHVISADVYLDITFTRWTAGGGGGFAYTRSTAVPEPGSATLLGAACLLAVGASGRGRRP
ncbi:MAG: hypothetical protein ACQGVK_12920 [Myxococcota bacterium]